MLYERTDFYFDLHVPGAEHYLAEGFWSHNTGKTFGIIKYCDTLMRKWPGVQIVWARDTLVNLRGSAMQIFEDHILWPGHPALLTGGSRENRTSYRYGPDISNPGRIDCIGLDNISKTQSREADVIVVFEATTPGVREHQWTVLTGMLRGFAIPHPLCRYPLGVTQSGERTIDMLRRGQFEGGVDEDGRPLFLNRMIGDCNPTDEGHWFWRRHKRGIVSRFRSVHKDNPTVRKEYLDRLAKLPPVLRKRWLEGLWVAADDLVWETYDPNTHIVSVEWEREVLTGRRFIRVTDWTDDAGQVARLNVVAVIAGMDWGHTDPAVLLVGAVTQDGRVFIIREYYEAGRGYDDWAARIAKCVDELGLECVRFSGERPEGVDIMNKLLGPRHGREAGGIVQLSDRRKMTRRDGDLGGLDVVREMFRQNRVFFARDMGQVVDRKLDESGLFRSVLDELPAYTKGRDPATGEVFEAPDESCVDHGAESLRYLLMDSWFRQFSAPKEVRFAPAMGTVAYQIGTVAERARLLEIDRARRSKRMERTKFRW